MRKEIRINCETIPSTTDTSASSMQTLSAIKESTESSGSRPMHSSSSPLLTSSLCDTSSGLLLPPGPNACQVKSSQKSSENQALIESKKPYLASIESLNDEIYINNDGGGVVGNRTASSCQNVTEPQVSMSDNNLQSSTRKSSKTQLCESNSLPLPGERNDACPKTKTYDGQNGVERRKVDMSPKYWDPDLSHVDRVIIEIIETERNYVNDLRDIIEGYHDEMIRMTDETNSTALFALDQISDLFSNIREIQQFNSSFLEQLEACGQDPMSLAECFIKNSSGFEIYTEYCTEYPKSMSVLTELMTRKESSDFLKEKQTLLRQTLPLGSYLLKPVQRVVKYQQLIQSILKRYSHESNGFSEISEALSVMTSIGHHINLMKKKHEHSVRVQEIQSLLQGWEGQDLVTFGELIAEGCFRMLGARNSRNLFLFDKMLLITKKKLDGVLIYKQRIMCSDLMLIESIAGQTLCFNVIPFNAPKQQLTFEARNLEQKKDWCLELKRVILENYSVVIPLHAREILMQLGQQNVESGQKKSNKRTLSAPEYLERRRKSADSLNFQKGFKLRKSMKKLKNLEKRHQRERSSSIDETAAKETNDERRCSLGVIELKVDDDNESMREESEDRTIEPESQDTVEETRGATVNCEDYVAFVYNTINENPSTIGSSNDSGIYSHRNSTCLSSGSSELSMASSSQSEDSTTASSRKYITPTARFSAMAENPCVRRVQSFTGSNVSRSGQSRKSNYLQQTVSFRYSSPSPSVSPTKSLRRPMTLNLLSSPASQTKLPSTCSLDDLSPVSPANWLKNQAAHLVASYKKGGSLPRSFESSILAGGEQHEVKGDMAELLNDRVLIEKTADSDDTVKNVLSSSVENIIDSSSDQLNQHPEHKVYKHSGAKKYIKGVLAQMGSKLAKRIPSENAVDDHSELESQNELQTAKTVTSSPRIMTTKLVHHLAKAYSNVIRSKLKTKSCGKYEMTPNAVSQALTEIPSPVFARMAMPSFCQATESNSVAAERMASACCDDHDDDSHSLLHSTPKHKCEFKTRSPLRFRRNCDSIISESSSIMSTDDKSNEKFTNYDEDDDDSPSDSSLSSSSDSCYERTFEAIESVLVEEIYRDTNLLTDVSNASEDKDDDDCKHIDSINHIDGQLKIVCARRVKGALIERLKELELNSSFTNCHQREDFEGLKSINQRRKELEIWCQNKNQTDDQEEDSQEATGAVEPHGSPKPNSKGWVKHVVCKLQHDVNQT